MVKNTFLIMLQLFKRDLVVIKNDIKDHIINSILITPLLFAFTFGYALPLAGGLAGIEKGQLDMFIGCVLWQLIPVAFLFSLDVLFDLEGNKFICYQATLVRPWLLIIEKIFFYSIYSFIFASFFFPITLTYLGYAKLLPSINWIAFSAILYLGALCISAFYMFFVFFIKGSEKIDNPWRRYVHPAVVLGGELAPTYAISKFSPTLGAIATYNPFMCISDGCRQAILKGDRFLSFSHCIFTLIAFSILFIFLSIVYFKKRIDHV
ncbi:hypothetical protein KAW80_01205 [Candidatus Babeliales bacterium]|nr:hypothetical protein [Candidatus Babeliales bacterium]